MILLLDEELDSPEMVVARSLDILGVAHRCSFRSLRTESPGLKDPEIPPFCRTEGIDVLVSANFHDFGAKLVLYEALLAAGVSVVVLRRQAKKSLRIEQQASVLAKHLSVTARFLREARPDCILLLVTESSVVRLTLEEIRKEITGDRNLA